MSELKDRGTHNKEASEIGLEFRERVRKQEVTVKDKRITAELAGKLKAAGTRDAWLKTRKSVEAGGKAVDAEMEKQKREHDRKAAKGEQAESKVAKASDASAQDAQEAKATARDVKTETGKRAIEQASQTSEEDSKWLKDLKEKRSKTRETSQRKTQEQLQKVKDTRLKFKH